MSFDLYETKEGDIGVFEFQQEFGHAYINNHSLLIDAMRKGMENILAKYQE